MPVTLSYKFQMSKIRAAWLDSDDGAGLETAAATVTKTPFTCCTLRDFAVGNQGRGISRFKHSTYFLAERGYFG